MSGRSMKLEELRRYCLSLPYTTENVQWGNDLLFKVGGKMFACAGLEPGEHWLSFKTTPENFAELIERQGVSPAKYLARAQWVAIGSNCSLTTDEIKRLVSEAHDLIFAKLPKKMQTELATKKTSRKKAAVKKKKAR